MLDLVDLQVNEGLDYLFDNFKGFPLIQCVSLGEVIVEVSSLTVVHDQEVDIFPLPNLL